jgi:ABC-type transporter Mla subunit MlaD
MARQTGEVSAQLSEQIRQLLTQQFQQMRSTQAAYESLDQATKRLRDLVKDSGEAFGQVQPLISDLVATTRDLRSVGEVARNAHRELQQITNSFAQQGQFLQQTTTSHKAILDEFSKVFDRVSQGLGGILRQIGEEMQRYQERSRESLSLHLQEFDKHLASATQHIKVSVEGIGPGLEALAEAIDAAAKRIGSNGGRR